MRSANEWERTDNWQLIHGTMVSGLPFQFNCLLSLSGTRLRLVRLNLTGVDQMSNPRDTYDSCIRLSGGLQGSRTLLDKDVDSHHDLKSVGSAGRS